MQTEGHADVQTEGYTDVQTEGYTDVQAEGYIDVRTEGYTMCTNIISNMSDIVKEFDVFSAGGEDRATVETDLSAPLAPSVSSAVSTSVVGQALSISHSRIRNEACPAYNPSNENLTFLSPMVASRDHSICKPNKSLYPDGSYALNSPEAFLSQENSPNLQTGVISGFPTSVHTCKHLGICDPPEHKEGITWGRDRERLVEGQKRISAVLESAGRKKEAMSVLGCCQQFRVYKALCCGDTVAFPYSCGHRLCPVCMRRRSAFLSERVRDILSKMSHPVHIVLTVKNVKHIDKAYFTWLRGCFTKLRHRRLFDGMRGGGYTIETTYNSRAGSWHVHLHILADVNWISQRELSSTWESITGSPVVWIRAVGCRGGQTLEKAVREIAKYIVKPGDFLNEPDLVNEYLAAVKSMRLFQVFGDFLGMGSDVEGFEWPECWCGVKRWLYVGDYPLEDIFKGEEGFFRYRPRSP